MELTVEKAKAILDNGLGQAKKLLMDTSKIDDLLFQLEKCLKDIPEAGNTLSDIPVLISMVKGYITKQYTEVSPKVILTIISAFIYFVRKDDLIPDQIPVVGKVDDMALLAFALKFLEPEINAYRAWRDGQGQTASEDITR